MNKKTILLLSGVFLIGVLLITQVTAAGLPTAIFDDFEDGESSDWFFFGGNNAGGGGGVLADRPKEGSFYMSTGWGGQGSASVFYGGFVKNLDEAAQLPLPSDPWFNVWVLNQSDATVDQYTLEITIREDLDGNGWTEGSEDSFRLDTIFPSSTFNDSWVLVSAPVSNFIDLGTGGDGIFNGDLDELVVVISGVEGADSSTVEVDFDYFAFTSGGPLDIVFDDMEHGDPFGNGWFTFGGSEGGGGIGPNAVDLPPTQGGQFSLETGWGSGGTPGFFGGFGRSYPADLSGTTHFNFWINPDAGQDYRLEINLQEDDNGDGAINPADDDEFQFNCDISATGPCAISGAGWQLVSIPLKDYFDDNSYLFGGNGILDAVPFERGGNGQLINIAIAVISNSGADVTFRTDYWVFANLIVDDFENGPVVADPCPAGTPPPPPLGFCTFNDPGSTVSITTSITPLESVPGSATGNTVLQMDTNVNGNNGFAGFIHGFASAAGGSPVPQNWSTFEGFNFWLFGNNTGSILFVDILDNRTPGSASDTAERFSVDIIDDFSGWRFFELPWDMFTRKEIGNGAPNDGFTLTEIHGYAFGVFDAGQAFTNYIDDVGVYGVAEIPDLTVSFTANSFPADEGTPALVTVKLNRAIGLRNDDPSQVMVDYFTEPVTNGAIPGRDYDDVTGTLTFVDGGPSELSFQVPTYDNNKYEGTKRLILRITNPISASLGVLAQSRVDILDDDPYDPTLLDDFERGAYLWYADNGLTLKTPEITAGDPLEIPDQGAYERVLMAEGSILVETVIEGNLCNSRGVVPVVILTTDHFDATTVDHTTVRFGDASEAHINNKTGLPQRHEEDFDGDGDIDLVFHFQVLETGYDCATTETVLTGSTYDGHLIAAGGEVELGRDFAIGQDWSRGEALSFWFYGTNSGDPIKLVVKDNRAPDPGPQGWNLVWSDEFDDPAGTSPNPAKWGYEIGDGTVNGIPGWGNDELQYYTDSTENAATDGLGNLVITAREADGSLLCYYGPCEYTSARLASKYKAEFAYGRIESRILLPNGGDGLWPAFWSLGTDIDRVDWPQTGEIDFMEYVSRISNEIFGTIHGPGYSGGQAFGNIYDFGEPAYTTAHTFAIEWQPDLMKWYVDGVLYHSATPADVAPNEWVFNDPVYLLLNLAVGGNFGGAVDPDTVFPQEYKIDYVHVYQGPDTAERWETIFTDNFSGWQRINIPFSNLTRSAEQPVGAPDDGLTLNEVWGYGFSLPEGGTTSGRMWIDQVHLELLPPPTDITVTNLNNSGNGSLRQALIDIANGGNITFDPGLTGSTISLTTGPLVPSGDVVIDASDAPGLTLDGGGTDRIFIIDSGLTVNVAHLAITNGYGFELAGGILNNGNLTLDHVTVSGNTTTTDAGDFWQGGGGIYNGDGATLYLVDSTVANNASGWDGGGIFSFLNTTTIIERSTLSGNIAANVGGGIRMLGNASIVNSTLSGNEAVTWHGGALFLTDGVMSLVNSTVADNLMPSGTASLFVGTFTAANTTLNLENSIIAEGTNLGCIAYTEPGATGIVTLTSLGYNVFEDGSCNPVASDKVVTDAMIGALADNGGPTLTHALLAGSPAIDEANDAVCPATDQRGVIRPQDIACDIGSYEFVP
jgi:beta-glucanase (GH16 family)